MGEGWRISFPEHEELCVETVPLFSNLEHDKLEKISKLVTHRQYDEGEIIFLVLFKDEPLATSARAISKSRVCVINKRSLEKLLKNNSELTYRLLSAFSSRLA